MNSLDPRVKRLGPSATTTPGKPPLDQFGTYEVFVKPKEGKPFQHEGIVHAPNLEMAYILAKEAFTRRFLCVSLYVVDTIHVIVSPITDGDKNIYNFLDAATVSSGSPAKYEIYHQVKRGKQHIHVGTVEASNPEEAMAKARQFDNGKSLANIWVIRSEHIRFTSPAEQDLWITLPEKKFRDAAEYKGGDKLKSFLEKRSTPKPTA